MDINWSRYIEIARTQDFDGMLVGMGEIAARGFDPDTFFSKTLFSHYQYPDVARRLFCCSSTTVIL